MLGGFAKASRKPVSLSFPGETPIIPVMLCEANRAQDLARALDERGLFVAGFFFPVVPEAQARIRTQMSAALTEADIDFAIAAFEDGGKARWGLCEAGQAMASGYSLKRSLHGDPVCEQERSFVPNTTPVDQKPVWFDNGASR